ncbi:MAG TPA: hypothetical protein VFZ73_12195 [Gemmatimonadaceae bacterium]
MRGFLTKNIERQLRLVTVGAAIGAVIVVSTAGENNRLAAPEFNQAELAVQRAQSLLRPSLCGAPTVDAVSCDSLVQQAEDLLAKARAAMTAASTIVDGGDVDVPRR